jgi:hypothetical protein
MCVSCVVSWVLREVGYAGSSASWVFGRKGGCVWREENMPSLCVVRDFSEEFRRMSK